MLNSWDIIGGLKPAPHCKQSMNNRRQKGKLIRYWCFDFITASNSVVAIHYYSEILNLVAFIIILSMFQLIQYVLTTQFMHLCDLNYIYQIPAKELNTVILNLYSA